MNKTRTANQKHIEYLRDLIANQRSDDFSTHVSQFVYDELEEFEANEQ